MTDKKISDDPLIDLTDNMLVPVVDKANKKNGVTTIAALAQKARGPRGPAATVPTAPLLGGKGSAGLVAVQLGHGLTLVDGSLVASAAGGGLVQAGALHKVVPSSKIKNTAFAVKIYSLDQDDTSNVNLMLVGLSLQYEDYIGAKFYYEIWQGPPGDSLSTKVVTSNDIFFTTDYPRFEGSAFTFLSNAALKRGIYMNVVNKLSSPIKFSAVLTFMQVGDLINPVVIPPYVRPVFSYTGPGNLAFVQVGPTRQFKEPRDAIPYLAPGYIMELDAGEYYAPYNHLADKGGPNGAIIRNAPGVPPELITWNHRGGWVTGYPRWQNNEGAGNGPINPFRLAYGVGGIRVASSLTVIGISFWYGGGGYGENLPGNEGDGEASIYAAVELEGFLRTVRCRFNGSENGIFQPHGGNGVIFIEHCTFGDEVVNGQTPDGLSHNFYINGNKLQVTYSSMFACHGNSAKSRSPFLTIDYSWLEASEGRAIDYPDGGQLRVTHSVLSQTSDANLNYIGLANESNNNGPTLAQFIDCALEVSRYDSAVWLGYGQGEVVCDFSPQGYKRSTLTWHVLPGQIRPSLTTQHGVPVGNVNLIGGFPTTPEENAADGTVHTPCTRPPKAHELPNALILDEVASVLQDSNVTLTGKTSGYPGDKPALFLSVDNGEWVVVDPSQVTYGLITLPVNHSAGTYTYQLKDDTGILSNKISVVFNQTGSGGGTGGGTGGGGTGGGGGSSGANYEPTTSDGFTAGQGAGTISTGTVTLTPNQELMLRPGLYGGESNHYSQYDLILAPAAATNNPEEYGYNQPGQVGTYKADCSPVAGMVSEPHSKFAVDGFYFDFHILLDTVVPNADYYLLIAATRASDSQVTLFQTGYKIKSGS